MKKIAVNLAIFFVIAGFVWYMITFISRDVSPNNGTVGGTTASFTSPYRQVASFKLPEEINRFDLQDNRLFISAGQAVYIFDTEGKQLAKFAVEQGVRDIAFRLRSMPAVRLRSMPTSRLRSMTTDDEIYLLYPTRIAVYSVNGDSVRQWEACSELSDYCSFTLAGDAVFVTDAAGKNICKYTTEGNFVKFINSPSGFIIPSYTFDINCWNDTVYCVNSGRHFIETYTLNGDFIAAFGSPGSEAGLFAGCCNPAYISFTPDGALIASEKGNPRVTCFDRNGKFKCLWLDSKALGGGTQAYQVKAVNDKLFVAGKNMIIVFQYDKTVTNASACSGCAGCPLRR